jgi:hypothetical protein
MRLVSTIGLRVSWIGEMDMTEHCIIRTIRTRPLLSIFQVSRVVLINRQMAAKLLYLFLEHFSNISHPRHPSFIVLHQHHILQRIQSRARVCDRDQSLPKDRSASRCAYCDISQAERNGYNSILGDQRRTMDTDGVSLLATIMRKDSS